MSTNWDVFTHEEKVLLKKVIANHDHSNLINVLESENITPEKERAIQAILKEYKVDDLAKESRVRQVIERKFLTKPEEMLTPEEEASWQAKLDAEKNGLTIELEEESPVVEEQPVEKEITIEEIQALNELPVIADDVEAESEEDNDDDIVENNSK